MAVSERSSQQRGLVNATLLLGGVTVFLGGLGIYLSSSFVATQTTHGSFAAWTDLIFNAVALLTLSQPNPQPHNMWFSLGRLVAVGFASLAIVTLLMQFSRTVRWVLGQAWIRLYSRWRPEQSHGVVVGNTSRARQLAHDLRRLNGRPFRRMVVLVIPDITVDMSDLEGDGVLVLRGNISDPAVRSRCLLEYAREVFIATGSDADNIDVAADVLEDDRAGRLVRAPHLRNANTQTLRHLQCHLYLQAPQFEPMFQAHALFQSTDDAIDVHTVNTHRLAARHLFLNEASGFFRHCAPHADEVTHAFIFGFGAVGQSIALEAARLAHFPNQRRLRLTILDRFGGQDKDPDVAASRSEFLDRHPAFAPNPDSFNLMHHLKEAGKEMDQWSHRKARPVHPTAQVDASEAVEYVANAEFLSIPARTADTTRVPDLLERLYVQEGPAPRPAIIVCFDDERRNARLALEMYEALRIHASDGPSAALPIYAYLPTEQGLAALLDGYDTPQPFCRDENGWISVHSFGQRSEIEGYDRTTQPVLETLAKGFHEAYRARYGGDTAYEDLSPGFKASNREAAAHARIKLHAEGWTLAPATTCTDPRAVSPEEVVFNNPETLAQMEHNRWMAGRLLSGWRYEARPADWDDRSSKEQKQIKAKMDERKVRSTIVPWEALNESERDKDRLQVEVLKEALANAGQRLVPLDEVS